MSNTVHDKQRRCDNLTFFDGASGEIWRYFSLDTYTARIFV